MALQVLRASSVLWHMQRVATLALCPQQQQDEHPMYSKDQEAHEGSAPPAFTKYSTHTWFQKQKSQ